MFRYYCPSPPVAACGDRLRHTEGRDSCILMSPLMYNTGHHVQSMPKSVSIQKLASYLH